MKTYRELEPDELTAIRAYAKRHGRTWKDQLRGDWYNASAPGILHALRNSHGPSWLIAFRLRPKYEVLVGNAGIVYAGSDWDDALSAFQSYQLQSMRGYGRVAHEPVTLFQDDEVLREHTGTLTTTDDD